jgi:predicted adenine nucleotide alpha hydrolase (AANH) superfamily ATPase
MPVQNQDNKILLHACCGICSGYPISLLKDMGYTVVVYFYNPNIHPQEEYEKRLNAEKLLCKHFGVELIEGAYDTESFFVSAKGFENEPEKGLRCNKCFELRLRNAAQKAIELGINTFTTSIVISPHKNFSKLSEIGEKVADEYNIEYLAIDFKKKDGFLKTNKRFCHFHFNCLFL